MKYFKTMKYQIKNRYTGEIIVEMEGKNLKEVVEKNKLNLQEADLREANLQGADLRGADFQEAKIKFSQIKDLIKGLGIIIVDE